MWWNKPIPRHQKLCKTCKVLDDEINFFLQCQINNNLRNVLINNNKRYHANFDQLDSFSQVKIILIPDQELRKWGSHWSMYNFNYEYMTFLYVVHVYMFCNVVFPICDNWSYRSWIELSFPDRGYVHIRLHNLGTSQTVLKKLKKLCILIQIKSDLLELFYLYFYIGRFYEIWIFISYPDWP